jgi:hypothetical protein
MRYLIVLLVLAGCSAKPVYQDKPTPIAANASDVIYMQMLKYGLNQSNAE